MGKILTGGIIIFFALGMTLTGFLLLENNDVLFDLEKPIYSNINAEMKYWSNQEAKQFVFSMYVTKGKVSIIGINTNLFKWEITGDINKTMGIGKIAFSMQPTSSNSVKFYMENVNDYFIQLFLSDGNIITWENNQISLKFNPGIQLNGIF